MKIILALFLYFPAFLNCYLSPTIFKTTKEIHSQKFVEIGTFDASKYKQIRVYITKNGYDENYKSKEDLQLEFSTAKSKAELFERYKDIHSKLELDEANEELEKVKRKYEAAEDITPQIQIVASDSDDNSSLDEFLTKPNHSLLIDTPPAKVTVRIKGDGIFKLSVWGTL